VSLYIAENARGSGIGLRLLLQLVQKARLDGFWTLQAAIFPENKASIHIHEKAGFRKVGVREKIAQRDGAWKDNVLMEIRL
jgi:phosphinothricin acetyltransferase